MDTSVTLEVKCETFYESEEGDVERFTLIQWLHALPPNVKVEPQPMVHGKLWLKATWTEKRNR